MSQEPISESVIRAVLAEFLDPETGRSVTQLGQIHKLTLENQHLTVTLGLTSHSAPLRSDTRAELANLLNSRFPQLDVHVDVVAHVRKPEKLGEIGLAAKSILAVGAGKGGVGKSSVACYLAFGLARAGCEVALLDADVYGPSIPHLVGSHERPRIVGDRIQPVVVGGVKVMSMGFLVPPGEAVIWRGPMLHGALTQFLRDTEWGELDYLIIDLPPGTGDVALSITQLVPLSGAVVVCTPQDVALLDAVKAVAMFRKVEIDVVGMIENMSFFQCPNCGSRHDIFGSGGAMRKAEEFGVPFLGEIPLDTQLRRLADEGKIAAAFDLGASKPYLDSICYNLARSMAALRRKQPGLPPLNVLG